MRADLDKSEAATDIKQRFTGILVRAIAYDMRGFFQQVVETYLEDSVKTASDFKPAKTTIRYRLRSSSLRALYRMTRLELS